MARVPGAPGVATRTLVVRVAGEILDAPGVGSIEYAVEHLGARLVVVLGHERCGAVAAAVKGEDAPGHISALTLPIKASVEKARKIPGDLLDNAIRENVWRVVEELSKSPPILSAATASDRLMIVGARYDLDTGEVSFLRR